MWCFRKILAFKMGEFVVTLWLSWETNSTFISLPIRQYSFSFFQQSVIKSTFSFQLYSTTWFVEMPNNKWTVLHVIHILHQTMFHLRDWEPLFFWYLIRMSGSKVLVTNSWLLDYEIFNILQNRYTKIHRRQWS